MEFRRYVQHYPNSKDKSATEALGDFQRFPKWYCPDMSKLVTVHLISSLSGCGATLSYDSHIVELYSICLMHTYNCGR